MPLRAAACSRGAGRDALAAASTLTQLRADFDAACVDVHAALREGPRNPAWPTPRKVLGWPLREDVHARCVKFAPYPVILGQGISNQAWRPPCLRRTHAARGPTCLHLD